MRDCSKYSNTYRNILYECLYDDGCKIDMVKLKRLLKSCHIDELELVRTCFPDEYNIDFYEQLASEINKYLREKCEYNTEGLSINDKGDRYNILQMEDIFVYYIKSKYLQEEVFVIKPKKYEHYIDNRVQKMTTELNNLLCKFIIAFKLLI